MANTNLRNFGFSSPSGDGLVLNYCIIYPKKHYIFVPEWGWVGSNLQSIDCSVWKIFSSPLGDGLVLTNNGYINRNLNIFVPEWGWVGS